MELNQWWTACSWSDLLRTLIIQTISRGARSVCSLDSPVRRWEEFAFQSQNTRFAIHDTPQQPIFRLVATNTFPPALATLSRNLILYLALLLTRHSSVSSRVRRIMWQSTMKWSQVHGILDREYVGCANTSLPSPNQRANDRTQNNHLTRVWDTVNAFRQQHHHDLVPSLPRPLPRLLRRWIGRRELDMSKTTCTVRDQSRISVNFQDIQAVLKVHNTRTYYFLSFGNSRYPRNPADSEEMRETTNRKPRRRPRRSRAIVPCGR